MLLNHLGLHTLLCLLVSTARAIEYDYIVVGAGSAGSIVAGELVRQGADVLLVEAGGDNNDPAIASLRNGYFSVAFDLGAFFQPVDYSFLKWGYETTPQGLVDGTANKVINLPTGRTLGGTGSINAGAYVVGHETDFDDLAEELGDSSWKFNRLRGIRRRLEKRLGLTELGLEQVGAHEYVDSAERVLGFLFNPNSNSGFQYGISPSVWTAEATPEGAVRHSSHDTFVRRLDYDRPENHRLGNLDVVTHHQVESLIFDETDPTRVVGVSTFNSRASVYTEFYASQEVILSAGTYNSPQILMLSGIGPTEHLEEMGIDVRIPVPGVGANLRDHYTVATSWNLADLKATNPFLFQSPSFNMWGPEETGPTTYQFEISGTYGSVVALRQDSVGTVKLGSSDPQGKVVIDPNVLSTEKDVRTLVDGLKLYLLPFFQDLVDKGLVTVGAFGGLDPLSTDEQLRDYVLNTVSSSYHPVGTCKVGNPESDPMAVVDSDFVVRGTSNLRVIDASVFPVVPSGNTNAPTMAIAMLGAKKITNDPAFDSDSEEDEDW